MNFSYAILATKPDDAFPERTALRRPLLGLLLKKNGKSVATIALVDSGADFCVFPASIAHALDIELPNPRRTTFFGTADAPQTAHFEMVQAILWNANDADAPVTFELYAGFCDSLEHVGTGLLGQDGFFSRFAVTFNYAANSMSIT